MLRSVLKQNAEQNVHLKPQVQQDASTHYSPASWTAHFDQRRDVKPFAHSDDTFGVYIGAEATCVPIASSRT